MVVKDGRSVGVEGRVRSGMMRIRERVIEGWGCHGSRVERAVEKSYCVVLMAHDTMIEFILRRKKVYRYRGKQCLYFY